MKTPPRLTKSVHSGWSPELDMRKRQMEELLHRRRDTLAPLVVPEPPAASLSSDGNLAMVLAKLTELTVGVNDLRAHQATAVTRADLQEFHEKARLEYNALVASQTEPLRDAVSDLEKEQTIHRDRIFKLETHVGDERAKKPDPNDVALLRISFKGFEDAESLELRNNVIAEFMKANFPSEFYACIDTRMEGPNGKKKPTSETFEQFHTKQARERVLEKIKSGSLKCVNSNSKRLEVLRTHTDWQRSRNYAMRKSEQMINEALVANKIGNARVEYIADKESRRITVNSVPAFVQKREDLRGQFVGDFKDLTLPA